MTLTLPTCALCTAGGGYAYYKKGSTASLQSSLSVAAALFASAWLLGVNPALGTALGLSACPLQAVAHDTATAPALESHVHCLGAAR